MKIHEHLILILIEEATEVAQAASKVLRFGPNDSHDGRTNAERLKIEFNDLLAIIIMINNHCDLNIVRDEELLLQKTSRLNSIMNYSKRQGFIDVDID